MDAELFELALSYHRAGILDQAEKIYQQLLERNEKDANLLHLYGILSAQKGNYELALLLITKALEIDPSSATFHNSMGNTLWYLEKFDDAIRHYETSIALQPDSPSAHNNLGNLYSKRENYDEAIEHYQSAINLKPDYADAYYNLAIVLCKRSQNKKAILNLQKAVELQPDFKEAQNQLAQLLQHEGDWDEALKHYLKFLELDPNQPDTYVNIGALLMKKGELSQAIKYFNHALVLDPDHYEAHYNLGATYLSLQNAEEALKHYMRCLNKNPEAETYFNIGVIYMYKDRYQDAIDYFNTALQLKPDYFEAHVNLGATYLKIENYAKAIEHYQEASKIKPDNEEIQYILSALTEQKTSLTKAPNDFVKHLFDQYAPYFDKHLTECLHYQAHILLFQEVVTLLNARSDLVVVDLGCGTGLCGTLFKPYSSKLIGIDIAPKMIEAARQKNVYDELIVDDITHALLQMENIDLIIAADVFGYLGELDDIFSAAKKALKKDGYFAFTVEKSENEPYALQKSTRFAHSKKYIHELCSQHFFKIVKEDEIQLRIQRQEPVLGFLFVLTVQH